MLFKLLLLGAIVLAHTGAGLYSPRSKVVQVDASDFDSHVLKSKLPVLVEFYAPWCGHCKNLAPTYEKVAQSLNNIAKVVAVDADNEKNRILAQRYGISGFPTIKLFKNGVPNDYQGSREKKPMVEFVKQNLPSKVKRISSTNVEEYLSKLDNPRALLFMPNDEVNAFFKALSVKLNGRMLFGQVSAKSSPELFKKYSISGKSGLVVFPAQSSDPIKFDKKLKNKSEVQAFIREHALPRHPSELNLPELQDMSCLKAHCLDVNVPLCAIAVTSNSAAFNKLEAVSEASQASESSLCKFSWIEGQKHSNFTSSFGIDSSAKPMELVFFSPRKSRFALFTGEFTKQGISSFLLTIMTGKAPTLPLLSSPTLTDTTSKCLKSDKQGKKKPPSKKDPSKDEL